MTFTIFWFLKVHNILTLCGCWWIDWMFVLKWVKSVIGCVLYLVHLSVFISYFILCQCACECHVKIEYLGNTTSYNLMPKKCQSWIISLILNKALWLYVDSYNDLFNQSNTNLSDFTMFVNFSRHWLLLLSNSNTERLIRRPNIKVAFTPRLITQQKMSFIYRKKRFLVFKWPSLVRNSTMLCVIVPLQKFFSN